MADSLAPIGLVCLAYVLGSLSTAFLVARATSGIDIRTVGSLNAGALNVFRQISPVAGLTVLLLDAGKGALVVAIARLGGFPDWSLYAAPIALVLGHNWPFLLGFRGGRGLAPVLGVSIAMLPLITFLSILPAAAAIAASRSVVLGAAVGLSIVNLATVLTDQPGGLVLSCGVLTALVALTHCRRRWDGYSGAVKRQDWVATLRLE